MEGKEFEENQVLSKDIIAQQIDERQGDKGKDKEADIEKKQKTPMLI